MDTLLRAASLIEEPTRLLPTLVVPSGYKMGDTFDVVTCHGDQLSFTAKGNGRVLYLPLTQPIKRITHTPALSQRNRVEQYVKKRNRAEMRRQTILKRQEATSKAIEKEIAARHLRAKLESKTASDVLQGGFVAPSCIHNGNGLSTFKELCHVGPSSASLLTTTHEKFDKAYEEAMNHGAVHTKRVLAKRVLATRVHSVQQ